MAAHIGHPTRSRRFIKAYLATWALLASGALAYLAVLTFPSTTAAPPPQARVQPAKSPPAEKDTATEVTVRQVKTTEVRSIAEVQGSLSEIRKDVSQLQVAVGERVENEKVVKTRLSALEERVSTIDPSQPASPAPDTVPGDRPPVALSEPSFRPTPEPEAGARVMTPAGPIETGSIVQVIVPKPQVEKLQAEKLKTEKPKAEIVFGEPVVTRANAPELAVQLAAAPSVQALKQSWGLLSEQHAALSALQPRVVVPRGKDRNYRLIAGPVATEADATRICSELGAAARSCFVTPYAGAPL
jgi:hypothetical protein